MVTIPGTKGLEGTFITGQILVEYHRTVTRDTALLLREFKLRRDPEQLYDAKITIVLEKASQFAMKP